MKAVRKRIKNQFIIKLKWTGWKGETSQSSVINGNWILHPLLRKLTKNCKINVNQMLRMSINWFSWCSGYHICLKSFQNKNGKKSSPFLRKRTVFLSGTSNLFDPSHFEAALTHRKSSVQSRARSSFSCTFIYSTSNISKMIFISFWPDLAYKVYNLEQMSSQ